MNALASFKAQARDACGRLLFATGLTAPAARLKRSLSILTFHRVLTESQRRSYPLPGLVVTPDELDAHLRFALRHFHCLPLSAALDALASDPDMYRPLLAVTFDDGQLDNYLHALPVLESHGVKASFYIPSQVLDDPSPLWHDTLATLIHRLTAHQSAQRARHGPADELLAELRGSTQGPAPTHAQSSVESALETTKSWRPATRDDWIQRASRLVPGALSDPRDGFMSIGQMKDLLARGHEIGSHSHSHPLLPQCTNDELQVEISGSRRRLERALDAPVTSFCYPNGSTDQRSIDQVREAGYLAAVTTRWGSNQADSDRFRLRRFDMNARHAQDRNGRFSPARLAWRISGWYPGLDPARQDAYVGASV